MADFTSSTSGVTIAGLLDRAGQLSRYARRLLANPPALFDPAQVKRPLDREDIRRLLGEAHGSSEQVMHRRMRHVRQAVLLAVQQEDYLAVLVGDPAYYKYCASFFTCGTTYESTEGAPDMNR